MYANIWINKGSCNKANSVTGKEVIKIVGIKIQFSLFSSTVKSVAPKATIIEVMAKKSVARPISNLFGNDFRKRLAVLLAVKIERNIIEDREENKASVSEIMNTNNALVHKKIGIPASLFPPGTINAAVNITAVTKPKQSCKNSMWFSSNFHLP